MERAAPIREPRRRKVDEQHRYCILNVDDFGLSHGVNRAIVDAHNAGTITSASLMVNSRASEAAAALAFDHPRLSVGLHVNMTNEGDQPIVDLDDVDAAKDELLRQADAFHRLVGKHPTHLDSHHHIHRRRPLTAMFRELADKLGVPLRDHSGVQFCGTFYAQWDDETHPEQVTFESLVKMLVGFNPGITELSTHIGYVDPELDSSYHTERELELRTILDPRLPGTFDTFGIELVGFADLPRLGWQPPAANA